MFCTGPIHPTTLVSSYGLLKKCYWLSDETKVSVCTFSLVNAVFSLSWMRSGILPECTPLPQAAWSFIPNCKVLAEISFPYTHGGGETRGKSQKTPAYQFTGAGRGAARNLRSAAQQLALDGHILLETNGGLTISQPEIVLLHVVAHTKAPRTLNWRASRENAL